MEHKHSEQAPMSIGWYINEIKRLEAEYASYKDAAESAYQTQEDCNANLRSEVARLTALVDKTKHAYSEWEGGSHREAIAAMEELKAALAEVK
jgi:uncharacterized small protein (DUF1192 family)